MGEQKVNLTISPYEFFREQIKDSSEKNSISFDQQTEFYLVNLLCQFIEPKAYFSVDEKIDFLDTPLALILKQALEASPDRQILLYKLLGDASLYLCGLFKESLEKKQITSSYVMALGSQAYRTVAVLMSNHKGEKDFKEVYTLLSENFSDIAEVFVTLSHETFKANKLDSFLKKMNDISSFSSEKALLHEFEKHGFKGVLKRSD